MTRPRRAMFCELHVDTDGTATCFVTPSRIEQSTDRGVGGYESVIRCSKRLPIYGSGVRRPGVLLSGHPTSVTCRGRRSRHPSGTPIWLRETRNTPADESRRGLRSATVKGGILLDNPTYKLDWTCQAAWSRPTSHLTKRSRASSRTSSASRSREALSSAWTGSPTRTTG